MNTSFRSSISIGLLAMVLTVAISCSKAPENSNADQSTSSSTETTQDEDQQPDQNTSTTSTSQQSGSSAASSLPEFNTSTVDGQELSHENLLGNVTVINYWGTWCPPCVEEIPHFQETYEKLNGEGFTILGIAIPQGGRGTLDDVKSFMKKHEMTYPVVMHESIPMDQFQSAFGRISGLPTTLVLDQSGQLQNSFIGFTSKEKLKNAIDPLMKK